MKIVGYYPWLKIIYNQILQSYRSKKGHHALILDSKCNYGEDTLISMLVHWLMCTNPDQTKFCNICNDCNLMTNGNHPNFFVLDLKNINRSVSVDIIKDCINSIYQCIRYNKVKVIFIKYVEYLTDQAIHVLLKILEEPPVNTYFFLKTKAYAEVPKILLSRCVKWVIVPPKESIGLEWLIQNQKIVSFDKLSLKAALRLSHRSPIEASFMLRSNIWKDRIFLCDALSCIIYENKNFFGILSSLHLTKYGNIPIYWLITVLIDALKKQQGIHDKFMINLDQLKLIYDIAKHWSIESLYFQSKQWLNLFYFFQKFDNINKELLLTYRLINWEQNIVETCLDSWSI